MKIKRILAAVLALAMLLITPAAFSAEDIVVNGNFETVNENGAPAGWSFSGSSFGESFSLSDKGYSGKALMIRGSEASLFATQQIKGIKEGQVYKFSTRFKSIQNGGMVVKFEFYGSSTESAEINLKPQKTGEWELRETEITVPFGADRVGILLRMFSGGECYYDEVSMVPTGAVKEMEFVKSTTTPPEGISLAKGEANFLYNPGFEALKADGGPKNWNMVGAGGKIVPDKGRSKNAIYFKNAEMAGLTQSVIGIIPGETYTATLWAKIVSGALPSIKVEFTNKSEGATQWLTGEGDKPVKLEGTGDWKKGSLTFTAPEKADSATIMIRMFSAAECYLDDISFVGKTSIEPEVPADVKFSAPVDGKYLIENGGFENGETGFVAHKGWNGGTVSLSTEKVHSGKYSAKVKSDGSNAWVCYEIKNIDSGATYEIQAWYNSFNASSLFKVEVYDKDGKNVDGFHSNQFGTSEGQWKAVTAVVPTSRQAASIKVYFRTFASSGEVYYDDLQVVKIAEPPKMYLTTDKVFYYTDAKGDGTATAEVFEARYPDLVGSGIAFELTFGEKVLASEKAVIEEGRDIYTFTYDLNLLAEKQKEYIVKAKIISKDGTLLEEVSQDIYKYDRPNFFKQGIYEDSTGEFIPTFVYHVTSADYQKFTDIGSSIFQTYTGGTKENLDKAHSMGAKCIVVLYANMLPAGHPDNLKRTIDTVKALKDNPGVFAWALMDEPTVYSLSPETSNWLKTAYKEIRDIDPDHPVYIVDNPTSEYSSKYSDIACYDLYVSGAASLKKVTEYTRQMYETSDYDKPVYALLLGGATGGTAITADAFRNQTYQAYYGGAFAVGGYTDNAANYCMEYGNHKAEMEDAYRHFVLGEYPIFNDYNGKDVKYRAYVKDGAIYLSVFSIGEAATQTVDVDFTSLDGSVVLNGFTAELLAGGTYPGDTVEGAGDLNDITQEIGKEDKGKGGGAQGEYVYSKEELDGHKMTVTVGLANAAYYKITPKTPIDTSKLISTSRFKDLGDYSWAREAVTKLDEKGIVNDIGMFGYGPGRNITRGELAMFLVRTLGLTGSNTDNFADVNPDAEYAKEIAIGKANGILQGIGDNKFNPEASITRQDLMTIISRGMKLSGDADLSLFTDGGAVSDYALQHVKAMIASGLIKGNADKTLNPAGNTTRAEAAVIMYRLLK